MSDVPVLFRVTLQVRDLPKAAAFYAQLLGDEGREIRGSRHYFDCGPVILALLDPTPGGEQPKPNADVVYFSVKDLDAVFERAKALNCLSTEEFHEQKAGVIVKRPWGERSFYAEDPSGNSLCFVDAKTLFTGN
jgi:predicted enzyme related to lactoylglutathione lyase